MFSESSDERKGHQDVCAGEPGSAEANWIFISAEIVVKSREERQEGHVLIIAGNQRTFQLRLQEGEMRLEVPIEERRVDF